MLLVFNTKTLTTLRMLNNNFLTLRMGTVTLKQQSNNSTLQYAYTRPTPHGVANEFPNLAVMARQYLGCPVASSAAVERLFSQVGIAFSKKRQNSSAAVLADIMFARCNLP